MSVGSIHFETDNNKYLQVNTNTTSHITRVVGTALVK